MSAQKNYIISQHRPYRWWLAMLIIVVLTNSATWFYSRQHDGQRETLLQQLQGQQQQLSTKNNQFDQHNRQLNGNLSELKQQLSIQKATDQQLQTQLGRLQNKVINLNKELAFYQNITQGVTNSKVQVKELQLSKEGPKSYRYRLVLTQGKKIKKPIKGKVTLRFNRKGKSALLIGQHPLSLRHVQILEGIIKLTPGTHPLSITVRLSREKKTLTTRTFNWQVANEP